MVQRVIKHWATLHSDHAGSRDNLETCNRQTPGSNFLTVYLTIAYDRCPIQYSLSLNHSLLQDWKDTWHTSLPVLLQSTEETLTCVNWWCTPCTVSSSTTDTGDCDSVSMQLLTSEGGRCRKFKLEVIRTLNVGNISHWNVTFQHTHSARWCICSPLHKAVQDSVSRSVNWMLFVG